jgi:hypothetical protein
MILAETATGTTFLPVSQKSASPEHAARTHTQSVVARDIADGDLLEVADLLHEGFPSKPAMRFLAALQLLARRAPVHGMPQFGYLLSSGNEIVGVLLTIGSEIEDQSENYVKCNLGCWYVRPAYRLYAPLLVLRSYRNRKVTHLNIWPARHTWETIKAQGFAPACSGTFVGMPLLSAHGGRARIHVVRADLPMPAALPAHEARILQDHAEYGCLSIVCEDNARFTPFIFHRRRFRRAQIPGAQLIYCRSPDDLSGLAGPVGRYLAQRGMPWLLASTNGRIGGIPGFYLRDKMPIYYKGPNRPREGDLTYTEAAMFGF